jgi:cobalt/nickel transport system permease protein
MHMADALVSPVVGGTMWAATAATTVYCAKKVREQSDAVKIPLMGVAGAFVFAAQMLNFTIPGTGSSGHLGGGLILALLLGPEAAFLVIASVLTVQALFFADGGLLTLGANIFNLGFFPAFIAYPFVYKPIVGANPTRARVIAGSVVAAVVGLQLGAFGVVLETASSGISSLPFGAFVLLMQPIHLGIGIVEGIITAAVALFIMQAQPELLGRNLSGASYEGLRIRPVIIGLAIAAVIAGGAISWFASTHADGLEWSIERVAGSPELEAEDSVHATLGNIQGLTAFLPDYAFKQAEKAEAEPAAEEAPAWPAVDAGTSVSGIVGAGIVLALAAAIGLSLIHI